MTRYEQGFMNKCAEHGIDGRRLVKLARSTPLKEGLMGYPASLLTSAALPGAGVFNLPTWIAGAVSGYKGDDLDDEETAKNRSEMNLLPFVSQYRAGKRNGVVARKMKELGDKKGKKTHSVANIVAETLGPLSTTALAAAGGAALGRKYMKDSPNGGLSGGAKGAIAGAGVAGVAELGAFINSLIRKRRTDEEQLERESARRAILKYIVPGLSVHDSVMRLGKSRDYLDDRDKIKTASIKPTAELRKLIAILTGAKRQQALRVGSRMFNKGVEMGTHAAGTERGERALEVLQAAMKWKDVANRLPGGFVHG